MKKFILFLVFTISIASKIFSQDFIKKSNIPIDDKIRKIMATRIAVVDYQIIDLDLSQIQVKDFFILDFFKHRIQLQKVRIERRGTNSFTLFASNSSKESQAIISVSDKDIQGMLIIENEFFILETLFDKTLITRIDQSKYPPEDCISFQKSLNQSDSILNFELNEDIITIPKDKKLYKTYPEQAFWNFQCKLRILVLYTTAAKNAGGNIENTIRLAIDQMNQSFDNSLVNFQVELVHMEETAYQEIKSPTRDLERFTLNNDGHMDNVHILRERYSADVCVLIALIDSSCGKAAAIKTCEESSFCIVRLDCATANLTFVHEIGHLIGARHDPSFDPNTVPYAYGHGFIDPSNGWRTIMALQGSCDCPRLLWWSNPNVTRNGQAMGTVQTHDNARVLNTYIPNVMHHRPHSGLRIVTQADILDSVGVIYHANKIETSGNLIIPNGYKWGFVAVNEIDLNLGFETESGSLFEAKLEPVCGSPDNEPCNFDASFDESLLHELINETAGSSHIIYPNPTHSNKITVQSSFNEIADDCMIEVYNGLGQLLFKHDIDSVLQEINLPFLPKGIYILSVKQNSIIIQNIKLVIR